MIGLGTIVNAAAILAGGAAGLVLKKFIPKRVTDTVMQGVALAVIIVGISGALRAAFSITDDGIESEHILLMIVSLAVGGLIGELLELESRLESFGRFCERKFTKPGSDSAFTQGFVTTTLIYCVGAMAIVGSLEDGINRNHDILFAKSALDGISAIVFASAMGVGVLFSAATVGLYQGTITLLSVFIAPYLSDVVVTQMSLIGSVLIMSIGMNMLGIAKIKVGNLLPAVFVPILYHGIRLIV
jgi:hypothetical protein